MGMLTSNSHDGNDKRDPGQQEKRNEGVYTGVKANVDCSQLILGRKSQAGERVNI
jgi:hypothetical protein